MESGRIQSNRFGACKGLVGAGQGRDWGCEGSSCDDSNRW